MTPDEQATLPLPPGWQPDLVSRMLRFGRGDPTHQHTPGGFARAWTTSEGPACLQVTLGAELTVRAWGPGAVRALEVAPELLGLHDDPSSFQPTHRLLRDLVRRSPPLYQPRIDNVVDAVAPCVFGQLVTTREAVRSYRVLLRKIAEPAPGPFELLLPPTGKLWANTPTWAYREAGLNLKRAATLRRIGSYAKRLNEVHGEAPEVVAKRIQAIPGLGPWSAGSALGERLGHADAVVVGDVHVPNDLSWALARQERGTDERMLELLEPFRPHRFRVLRLVHGAGIHAPRRGPKRGGGAHR